MRPGGIALLCWNRIEIRFIDFLVNPKKSKEIKNELIRKRIFVNSLGNSQKGRGSFILKSKRLIDNKLKGPSFPIHMTLAVQFDLNPSKSKNLEEEIANRINPN